MEVLDSTSWSEVRAAAAGDDSARAAFASRYAAFVRDALTRRWRGSWRAGLVDDAVQEVFVECFKPEGVLFKAAPEEGPGFRVYLAAVVRNVARRLEDRASRDWARRASVTGGLESIDGAAGTNSIALDREWARSLVVDAAAEQRQRALSISERAVLRADLLELHYGEGVPVPQIAEQWRVDAAWIHHQLPKAKAEFRRALEQVLRDRSPGAGVDLERRIEELMGLLEQ